MKAESKPHPRMMKLLIWCKPVCLCLDPYILPIFVLWWKFGLERPASPSKGLLLQLTTSFRTHDEEQRKNKSAWSQFQLQEYVPGSLKIPQRERQSHKIRAFEEATAVTEVFDSMVTNYLSLSPNQKSAVGSTWWWYFPVLPKFPWRLGKSNLHVFSNIKIRACM